MFLQNILQKRLQSLNEEEERYLSSAGNPTRSVFKGTGQNIMGGGDAHKTIGSIHNRQTNYSPEHTFFNQANHMFPKAQATREVVLDEIDRDLLKLKNPQWQQSVELPKQMGDLPPHHDAQNQFLIRHGFKDQKWTREDPQMVYAGTDTRDVYYHGWDISHEQTPPRDKQRQYQMERTFLMDKTSRVARSMTSNQMRETTRHGITSTKYINPEQISGALSQKYRMEKDQEQALCKELFDKARYEFPDASVNRLDAIVYRQIMEINKGKVEEEDPELTLKPDCTMSAFSKPDAVVKQKQKYFKGQPYGKKTPSSRQTASKAGEEDNKSNASSEFEWGKYYD